MLTLRSYLTVFFVLGLLQTGQAQVYTRARTLTVTDGLSDNRATCFYKDRTGYMWIGTRNGLNRYDGHSFRVFRPAAGNSISNEVINDIAEDSRGRIWVATMYGLNIFDPQTERWEVMLSDPAGRGNSIPNQIIWKIQITPGDQVWIAADVFEFGCYDIRSQKFTFYDWPGFARSHPAIKDTRYHSIQRFARKSNNEWWLGTTNGLVLLNTETGQFRFIGGGYYADVFDLQYDAVAGYVFISTEKDRFFRYAMARDRYTPVKIIPEPYPSTRFHQPEAREIWMASETGIIKVSDDRAEISLEKNIPQLSGSLLPGGAKAVYEDNDHLRWVATPNGVSIYDRAMRAPLFFPLLPVSDKEGLNRMSGVYYDDSSQSYFVCALDPPAVFIINRNSGGVRKITTDASGRKFALCTRIKKDRNGHLWLLTGTHVYRYDRSSGNFWLIPGPGNGQEIVFRDMFQDLQGDYWFGSFNGGVFHYDPTLQEPLPFRDSSVGKYKSVTGLARECKSGKLMCSTFGEYVFLYHDSSGSRELFYETASTPDYSHLSLVNDLASDAGGRLWMATHSGGLFRFEPGKPFDKAFTHFDMRNGLSSNNILSVSCTEDSVIWMLSGKGLSAMTTGGKFLFDLGEKQTFPFSTYASDSRYPHNIHYSKERKEILAGVGGGLFIYPVMTGTAPEKFPVVINRVRLNDKWLTMEERSRDNRLRLPFHDNTASFEFAGLYYGSGQATSYEYQLSGYDRSWKDAGSAFEVRYQNLPPGSYSFRVRARNADGSIAGETREIWMRIVPPFWRTWWFILFCVLLFLALIGLIIRSLRQKLKVEQAVSSFVTSLYGLNSTEDIFWDLARNCILKLGFVDCVVYQRDELRDVLVQKAAFGPKNPQRREILNIIEIPVGQGIVGLVAQTGKPALVANTAKDRRYIVDDERRLSEIAVPVIVDGKVFAVIDSEHPVKGFYRVFHLRVLKKIAAVCAERIVRHLTEEKLRAKIARDLHDEMGSTLTSINIISKVAIEQKTGEHKAHEYFQKIKDHSGRMMESMSDMVWAINPVNDNFGKVILRMKEFAAEILEPARIQYYFGETTLPPDISLNPEQRKNIYLIYKEALNNVVKYSQATEVNIIFNWKDELFSMMISDNGTGFDPAVETSGNGLRNMQFRAGEMGALIRVDTIPGSGTSVTLRLPVT